MHTRRLQIPSRYAVECTKSCSSPKTCCRGIASSRPSAPRSPFPRINYYTQHPLVVVRGALAAKSCGRIFYSMCAARTHLSLYMDMRARLFWLMCIKCCVDSGVRSCAFPFGWAKTIFRVTNFAHSRPHKRWFEGDELTRFLSNQKKKKRKRIRTRAAHRSHSESVTIVRHQRHIECKRKHISSWMYSPMRTWSGTVGLTLWVSEWALVLSLYQFDCIRWFQIEYRSRNRTASGFVAKWHFNYRPISMAFFVVVILLLLLLSVAITESFILSCFTPWQRKGHICTSNSDEMPLI